MTKARDLANGGFGLVLVKPSSVVNGTDNGKGFRRDRLEVALPGYHHLLFLLF